MGLSADLPYPSLDGIKQNPKTLRIVSPAYAGRNGELTSALQYVYQSVVLGAEGMKEEAKLLMDIAVSEMHHIEILGTLITKLGAPPLFTACPPYPVGFYSASCVNYVKSFEGMIEADISAEQHAIAEYDRMLNQIENPDIRAVILRIREDETVHLAALNRLCEKAIQ